mmetsp:Transcript_39251/g.67853  ORF Transcript_39251/g.67853 Transcript_39251/m.67853 type:complete len:222 (+) Transcript_39251:324-989(+)
MAAKPVKITVTGLSFLCDRRLIWVILLVFFLSPFINPSVVEGARGSSVPQEIGRQRAPKREDQLDVPPAFVSGSVFPREHLFSDIQASPTGSVHSGQASRKEEGMNRDQCVRHSLPDDQMQFSISFASVRTVQHPVASVRTVQNSVASVRPVQKSVSVQEVFCKAQRGKYKKSLSLSSLACDNEFHHQQVQDLQQVIKMECLSAGGEVRQQWRWQLKNSKM